MRIIVPAGVGPPSVLDVQYDPGSMLLNLALVTAISLNVVRRDGSLATWACTLQGASQRAIAFTHAWALADCTVTGLYTCTPVFTVGGHPVPGNAFYVDVQPASALRPEVPS